MYLQWIPAHVGTDPNEEVNNIAQHYSGFFHRQDQIRQPIELQALKSSLKRRLKQQWIRNLPQRGCRYDICGIKPSHMSSRRTFPRALQTLYSRWRVGEVERCGVYPRRMKWIEDPRCRFCRYPCETTVHLLSDCPDTAEYRITHGMSFDTLVHETPANIILIAEFDALIRRRLGCHYIRTQPLLESVITNYKRKPERAHPTKTKVNNRKTKDTNDND
jgi:hypothetical protein